MKLIVLFFLTIPCFLNGQNIDCEFNGKKISLNENGTWEYISSGTPNKGLQDELNCESIIIRDQDKMTGDITFLSKESILISKDDKDGLSINCFRIDKNFIFSIVAVGASNCIKKDNEILILLRNGERLSLKNNLKFNCKNESSIYFGNRFSNMNTFKKLIDFEIETMRVWTSDGYVEEDFTKDQSKLLKQTLSCLYDAE